PSCTTVKVWPATVSVPVRGTSLMFSLTSKVIVALPVAPVSEVIMTQPSLLIGVQLQAGPAVTVVDASPPAAVNGWMAEERVNEHGRGGHLKKATAISS